MKIVIISPFQLRLSRGVERFTYSLANELASEGLRVTIYTWGSNNDFHWGEWHDNISIRKVPAFRYYIRFFAPFYYRNWLRKDNPDAVLLNFLYHGESKLPSKHKYLYIFHSPASQIPERYEFIKQSLAKFSNLNFVAVSKIVAKEAFPYVQGRKISVIPTGVDTNKFRPIDSNKKDNSELIRLISTSAFEERKGLQYIIQALAHYPNETITYDIYGEGPYKNQLIELIEKHQLQSKVNIHAPINNVEDILPQYDVFCLPSKGEAFALAPIEALSSSVPILVSRHPPYDELVKGPYGIKVDETKPSEIIESIFKLAKLKTSSPEMIREAAFQYDWSHIAKEYLKTLEF